jgi:hypothetical protein
MASVRTIGFQASEKMRSQVDCGEDDCNNRQSRSDWQFTTADGRIRLKHVHPKI